MEIEEKEIKRKPKPVEVVYIGKGKFISGIPARTLTLDEWKDMPKDVQDYLLKSGLYEVKHD